MESSFATKSSYYKESQDDLIDLRKSKGGIDDTEVVASIWDYISLMKPRVMMLVVFTGFCGMMIAPNSEHFLIKIMAILSISFGSGAAGAINMWYDKDIDTIMSRTQRRPTVRGVISAEDALDFGIIIALVSVIMMALCVNITSSLLLAFTILYYVFIYTMWLKRTTIQNVVIGGISGALPPLIGWTSVNTTISLEPLILVMIIFLWTPPHSFALALFRIEDYTRCKVPMMPVIKGRSYTYYQILFYSILMVISSVCPYFMGMVSILYLGVASILNIFFMYYSILLFFEEGEKVTQVAKRLFYYSIFYLMIIFLSILIFHI